MQGEMCRTAGVSCEGAAAVPGRSRSLVGLGSWCSGISGACECVLVVLRPRSATLRSSSACPAQPYNILVMFIMVSRLHRALTAGVLLIQCGARALGTLSRGCTASMSAR